MEKTDPRTQKIKELLDAGKAKGILTYKEIMDALEELELDQEQIEKIYEHLEEMNIDVVEEVEVPEDINEEIAEIESTLAAVEGVNIDDPVRMYLKQMGQVSLLTREEEVAISKRIEDAEQNVQRSVHRFGFIANAYLDVAYRLLDNEERFDRVILDKKIDSRERYMKGLAQLCAQIQQTHQDASSAFRKLYRSKEAAKAVKLAAQGKAEQTTAFLQLEQLKEELAARAQVMQARTRRSTHLLGKGRMLRAYPKLRHGEKHRSLDELRERLKYERRH